MGEKPKNGKLVDFSIVLGEDRWEVIRDTTTDKWLTQSQNHCKWYVVKVVSVAYNYYHKGCKSTLEKMGP